MMTQVRMTKELRSPKTNQLRRLAGANAVTLKRPPSSSARFQFLSNDASQRLLEPRHLSVEVLPQGPIDKSLIPGCTPRFLRHLKEAIHNILVEPNCDSSLADGLRFGWKHSAPLPFAEIISILHRSTSYSSRS